MHRLVCHGGYYPLTRSADKYLIGSHLTSTISIRNGHPLIPTSDTPVSIKALSALDILEKDVHYNMSYAAKAKSQQFTRRKSSLVKKEHELVRLCNFDLALIIRKNRKYYTYRSTDHESGPPTIIDIVGRFGANND